MIRISDETLRRLKTWAEPLEDTAESAVSKVLDAAEGVRGASTRTQTGPRTAKTRTTGKRRGPGSVDRSSQRKFRKPLLRAIYEMGGSARTGDLYPVIGKFIAAVPLSGNMNNFSSRDKRWQNARMPSSGSAKSWLRKVACGTVHLVELGNCLGRELSWSKR